MDYEMLLDEADSIGVTVKELNLKGNKGRIKGNRIAIKKDIATTAEKSCILAEELGHYYTTAGDINDLQDDGNQKQEHIGRVWGYNKKIGLIGITRAFEAKCQDKHEIAEFLDVTESYLEDALNCYKAKYGLSVEIGNYRIVFEPALAVIRLF